MARESKEAKRKRAAKIVRLLAEEFPDVECALHHANALQLLISTMLSAQCTDERVNRVTPALFKRYPAAHDYAAAAPAELEALIHSTGFFHNKAKNIKACCRALVDEHAGRVPRSLEALVKLPGIGRKTANVVLGTAYGIPSGVVVDTHVQRISSLLRLTRETNPVKIEKDLIELLPRETWIEFSHRLIWHGRKTCVARRPKCDACRLAAVCPSAGKAQAPKKKTAKKKAKQKTGGRRKAAGNSSARGKA